MMAAMPPPVPTAVPEFFVAGDTLTWKISLPDYPANAGWTLKYRLINAAGRIDITAAASGADHLITVATATSAAYVPGKYTWQAYVEKSTERYTVGSGAIEIKPNLAAQTAGYDTRSPARKALDAIDAALATYGNKAWTQSYQIAGRGMTFRSNEEFVRFRSKLIVEVRGEEAAERMAAGLSPRRKIRVRFGRV